MTAEISRRVRRTRIQLAIVGLGFGLPGGALFGWAALVLQWWLMDEAFAAVIAAAACVPLLVMANFGGHASRWLVRRRTPDWRREFLSNTTLKEDELDDVLAIFT